MAAVVDHVQPYSRGGTHDQSNFATACNKCNTRKNAGAPKEPRRIVKGKYGEPRSWDGFSTLFVLMLEQDSRDASKAEIDWHRAFKSPEDT